VAGETVKAKSDGLAARSVAPHTREKYYLHGQLCGIFNGGMRHHWRHNRGYLELFAGPGLAVDLWYGEYEELDGCPLIAAASEPPFAQLVFVEYDVELAAALNVRLEARGHTDRAVAFADDANDLDVLGRACELLPEPGLTLCFVDPEDINGDWEAIRFLAQAIRCSASISS
jgi:hypothetical protein